MLYEQLLTDRKQAILARDTVRLNTIRFILGAVDRGTKQDDQTIVRIIASFTKDAAGQSTISPEEVAIMQSYLPKQLTAVEVRGILSPSRDLIAAQSNPGRAMGVAMKALSGQAVDSKVVQEIVSQLITEAVNA